MRNYENYERKRNIYIGFRMTPEEKERLNKYVKMSGMTFRDYVTKRALQEDVVVVGNTRVYKALRSQMEEIICELKRISAAGETSEEFLKVLTYALKIYEGMKEDRHNEQ